MLFSRFIIVTTLSLFSVFAFGADDVRIALDWTPNTNHTGLYAAKAEGYFTKDGINPIFVQHAQTTATQLVATSKSEFGISFMSDVFKARAKGLPVRVVAAILQENTACFAWRNSTGIKTIKDWEGKRYGGWGSPEEEATLKYIMEKNGADFSKLKIATTGIGEFLPSTERNADFMWIYMGWSGIQAKLAGVPFTTLCARDIDPVFNKPSPLIITSEKLIAENPSLIKKFMHATSLGYQLAIDKPQKGADALLKEVPELDRKLVEASAKFLAGEYSRGAKKWGVLEGKKWEEVGKWMLSQKLIAKVDATDRYFTNEFLPVESK